MKRLTFLFALYLFIAPLNYIQARHIVGGEMNYRFLGGNQYQVTLTVYRDCFGNGADFDDPAIIGFYDAGGTLFNMASASISLTGLIPNAINSPCLTPPTNICYEVAQYIFTTTIPSGSGDVTIVYQRCCRNLSVANVANIQGTGATYMAVIPDPAITPVNSNPVFNDWPPTFICKDAPFTFDHSATDADGDSLVYELSYPFDGADATNPVPNPPPPPPYSHLAFLPPYSINNVLGGMPMEINPSTGLLRATPNNEGQYVYGVSVKEYRNGVYLGETRRDFQVNVVPCPGITVASIYSPTIACGSLDASFLNISYNAATYSWSFGDPTSTSDTSTEKNPVYSYPDTGDYMATLIAYSGLNPLCNDTASGIVHVYPLFMTDFYISNNHCSNVFTFTDQSNGINGTSNFWTWSFGDNSNSDIANPVHTFTTPGEYSVQLISSVDSACTDTLEKTVYVLQNPESKFSISLDTCTYTIQTHDSSLYGVSYRWNYGDYGIEYHRDGTHYYPNPGPYTIQLIVATDSACVDTAEHLLTIPPLPIADFQYQVEQCDSDVYFINTSNYSTQYIWSFGDGTVSNEQSPMHTYSLSGYVPVRLFSKSAFGCENTIDKGIFFVAKKKAFFEIELDSCKGLVDFINVTKNSAYYSWDFGDGSTSNDQNPVHRYDKDGEREVTLTLNIESACSDAMTRKVNFESPLGEKIFIPTAFTPNADGHNDLFEMSIFRPCEIYKLTIFNRWGQIVLESNDAANVVWDGTFNGEKLAEDLYVYILEGNGTRKQGFITIMR